MYGNISENMYFIDTWNKKTEG